MGFARLAETVIRNVRGKSEHDPLGALDKILASSVGGALATWNKPIEVILVGVRGLIFCLRETQRRCTWQMQSMAKEAGNVNRPAKLTIMITSAFIYKENGIRSLYTAASHQP